LTSTKKSGIFMPDAIKNVPSAARANP